MPRITIVFHNAVTAEYRVAGVPAAARAVRMLAAAFPNREMMRCTVDAGPSWTPSATCRTECMRLAPTLSLTLGPVDRTSASDIYISGEALIIAAAKLPADDVEHLRNALDASMIPQCVSGLPTGPNDSVTALRHAGHAIVAATGKAGDGIVSRFINRPISQTMSRWLLRIPGLTPLHATLGAAALGVAMALCLLFGGKVGLIAGAILFQAASIVDGIDGEIARATFRTSDRGAMLDSVIDALTNLAFVLGLTLNRAIDADLPAATAGAMGLAMLATGLFLIGRRAKQSGQPVNFDVIKVHFRKRRSRIMEWLIWFTMRDFFAATGAFLILIGLTRQALYAFAIVAAIWLIVTVSVLIRTGRHSHAWTGKGQPNYTDSYII